jgi:thioesterase domain-containing protein/acyl carrier protein
LNLFDFLAYLRSLDIQVMAENGKLRVNAPQGSVTPGIMEELNARKREILSLLEGLEPIPLVSRDGPMPLSPAQEHLWQLQRLTPDTIAYNMYAVFRICGSLDINVFEQAIGAVVERHWTLRTSFPRSADGVLQQVIAPASTVVLQRVSLPHSQKLEEELHSHIDAEIRKPFDLQTGPLFRPTLVQIDSMEFVLLLVMHHIVSDGHSFGVLYNDLQLAYLAGSDGKSVDWPSLPVQYIDYAAWLQNWLESDGGLSDRKYWQTKLAGEIYALEIPSDHPSPLRPSSEGSSVDLPIQSRLHAALQELCRQEGVTLFAVALTAFNVLLHRYSGQQDLLISSPVAARDRIEFGDLIGYFNNTLLLRSDLSKVSTLRQLLQQTQTHVMEALAHQMFPFREVAGFPNLGRIPLSRGMVVVLDSAGSSLRLSGLEIGTIPVFSEAVQYDLSLELMVSSSQTRGRLMYRTVLFERSTAERLSADVLAILTELTTDPENKISLEGSAKQVGGGWTVPESVHPPYAAPRSDLERKLAQIWQEVLEVERIGIHDEFFELGGHSLLALRLFTRIEQETGTSLPLSTLFGTTTIASLAGLIEGEAKDAAWEILVPIQPKGSKPPFFSIHGVEGGVLGYRDLAIALGEDQPFLGLQAKGLDGREAHDSTVEELAACYIEVMRSWQPTGPYRMGGYCFGGVVAFEMARQLEKVGERVSVLAVFEGSMPDSEDIRVPLLKRLGVICRSLPAWVKDYSGMSPRQLLNRLRTTFHKIWSKIQRHPGEERRMRVEETLDRIDVADLPSRHIELTDAFMNATVQYMPGVYNGEVTLFRARNRSINEVVFGSLDPKMGWGRLAKGGVDVRLVDGYHRNMHLAPYASSLAAELRKCLDEDNRGGDS